MEKLQLVVPHLFIGAHRAVTMKNLKANRIRFAINLSGMSVSNSATMLDIRVDDDERAPISDFFDLTFDLINHCVQHQVNILVFCAAGASRSATIVLNYLIKGCGMSLDKALSHLKRVRPVVMPNQGFLKALEQSSPLRQCKTDSLFDN